MSKFQAEIRDSDHWDVTTAEETFQGVPLKHVWDHLGNLAEIPHEERCPSPS